MLARQSDPSHPFHEANTAPDLAAAMTTTYREIDELVGKVMQEIDPGATLVVMSDHGFAPFRRQAHLNAWLEQNGYLALKDPAKRNESEWLAGIDWSKTRAFAIGLNSLYLNVRGRERDGIVPVAERAALAREIAQGLQAWRDGANGESVVTQASLREDVYHGPYLRDAPDIVVGYARGYRASWATTSGKIPAALIEDNAEEWSGDHCIDSREVPGVLLVNRPIKARDPDLTDLTVAILKHFGVPRAAGMRGTPAF
jgi:predicted AlkP superfamily phosphohydrolase/phosphomutase